MLLLENKPVIAEEQLVDCQMLRYAGRANSVELNTLLQMSFVIQPSVTAACVVFVLYSSRRSVTDLFFLLYFCVVPILILSNLVFKAFSPVMQLWHISHVVTEH